ncbi:MAG: hypothetical protein ACO25F_06120 [Erythrobacter sp.]
MNQPVKAPWHLWAIGLVTLLWNAIGIMSYMMTRLDMLDQLGMTPDQIAYFDTFPALANALWALGVWGAFLGSVLLLARSRWAVPSLMVSVVGLVGTTVFQRFVTEVPEGMSNPAIDIAIWVITLFMLWYAHRMRGQGVLS